jgi:hypothetical protein
MVNQRAASLQGNDPLATLLFQIASPAHIPWGDTRWQELLHGYDVWVHMEDSDATGILSQACQSMAKHAAVSSNLAALSLHVTRMLRELVRNIQKSANNHSNSPADFSKRISRVAKARATAGALQLLTLLCHPVVVKCSSSSSSSSSSSINTSLEEAFMYHTRGDLPYDQPAGRPLVHSIMDLITVTGNDSNDAIQTPEVYDAVVLSFQLLFVLCGTQLYQPFQSSFQTNHNSKTHVHYDVLDELFRDDAAHGEPVDSKNFRIFYASSRSYFSQTSFRDSPRRQHVWTPHSVLAACMEWQIRRPPAPERSIAHYYYTMAQTAVSSKGGETLGPDGMYESHLVVQAAAPNIASGAQPSEASNVSTTGSSQKLVPHSRRPSNIMILDATKGVFVFGSSIILLPFRLMSLVFGVITSRKGQSRDGSAMRKFASRSSARTKDALWLSESILADLGSCLILLLANNNRNRQNAFRTQLAALVDNRWEFDKETSLALPDLPRANGEEDDRSMSVGDLDEDAETQVLLSGSKLDEASMTVNFESLFDAFGRTLHTEVGALMLYTLFQSSPSFAESLAVRSDLDTLVLPLLRTLYFASSTTRYMAKDFTARRASIADSSKGFDIRSCPFRSQSQLYVIIILLLLFSQDASFGRDAFRRINVNRVLWYRERNLRNINLGSVLVLTLLRSLMFNLQRLQDVFLLSNCCAVLMNMSPSIVDLHEYAAMRLASVTVSVMKKYSKLHAASAGRSTKEKEKKSEESDEEYMSTPLGMYEEVARTLLSIVQHCLSSRNMERNLHLVYALVYHQADFTRLFKENNLYSAKQVDRIQSITLEASAMIQEEGARTAPKALKVLEEQIDRLQKVADKKRKKEQLDDFTFTYEEEADPEIFFVPYVWETIVCAVTSSTIEWKKDEIRAFALLDPIEEPVVAESEQQVNTTPNDDYAKDAEELV